MDNFYCKLFIKKNIILTGASGKIGSLIAEYFDKSKSNLILIDKDINQLKKKYRAKNKLKSNVKIYKCDFE